MNRLKQLSSVIKERGAKYAFGRLTGVQPYTPPPVVNYALRRKLFKRKSGIEIGGPSGLFEEEGNYIPLYNMVKSLDNCNFSGNTIWEGAISGGKTFRYGKNKTGTQYISEATEIGSVVNKKYDFLLSSNCLEHIANPLKAVKEWLSVLKSRGIILLILPNKDYCFDHNRTVTPFSHLLEDFKNNTREDDLTHLDEILKLHDLSMDLPAGTPEQFKARSLKNFENRALHQHVFDIPLLKQILDYMNVEVLFTHVDSMHVIIGKKKE